MSSPTFAPVTGGFANDPQYAAGRADAYDDSHTRTIHELEAIARMYAEYGNLAFAFGYADRVIEVRMERAAVNAAETELAQTWNARKQGRATSTLHTRHRNTRR